MRTFILVPFIFILCSCGLTTSKPDPMVVVKTEYVVRQAPDSMYALPPQVVAIDPDTASQREIAVWIIQSEDRTNALENMLGALKIYFNKPAE